MDGTLSVFFVVIAELVAVAFFIALFVVDGQTLHEKYGDMFTPQSVTLYKAWGTITLVGVALLVISVAVVTFDKNSNRTKRDLLLVASALYLVLLASGNALGASETAARRAATTAFAVEFNAFYCHARTMNVCMDGDAVALLQLTRGSHSLVQPSENATEAVLGVWSHCQEAIKWAIEKTPKTEAYTTTYVGSSSSGPMYTRHKVDKTGVLEIDTKPLNAFLNDCSSSPSMDVWCGDASLRATPMTDTEQQALLSPYASNPSVFVAYTREWSRRMTIANALVSTVVASLVLAVGGLLLADTLGVSERRRLQGYVPV